MEIASTGSLAGPDIDARALAALAKSRNFSTDSVRLLLRTKELILLGKALVLGQWRDSRDPVTGAFAEHCQAEIKNAELREALDIIRGRIVRMPAAHRKRYSPEERFRIVVFVRTYGLTQQQAADTFLVDAQTIARWTREVTREPDRNTVGSLIKATPPVRSYNDVTKHLVALLDGLRVGGSKRIAQMLVRAGTKISRETVRRYRRKPPPSVPAPPPSRETSAKPLALRAKEPNHVWMTDITTIPSLLRIWIFKLVVVLDVYARFPLAFRVFSKEPTSSEIADLAQLAAGRFGKPKHFVTDRGAQFTGDAFTGKLRELGVKHRFGAIGRSGSIAIIERLWRTLKELLDVKFLPPLSLRQLEHNAGLALFYYSTLRPHQGLGGATPTEIYFRLTPATTHATPPPRATTRDPATPRDPAAPIELPFDVVHLDPVRRLPFLIPRKRAA